MKLFKVGAVFALVFFLSACSDMKIELPENPIVFEVYETEENGGYLYLTNGDKKYVPYGGLYSYSDTGECVGYYNSIPNETNDGGIEYIFSLKGEPVDCWLVEVTCIESHPSYTVWKEVNVTEIPKSVEYNPEWYPFSGTYEPY